MMKLKIQKFTDIYAAHKGSVTWIYQSQSVQQPLGLVEMVREELYIQAFLFV
jgi:hypothetical protein